MQATQAGSKHGSSSGNAQKPTRQREVCLPEYAAASSARHRNSLALMLATPTLSMDRGKSLASQTRWRKTSVHQFRPSHAPHGERTPACAAQHAQHPRLLPLGCCCSDCLATSATYGLYRNETATQGASTLECLESACKSGVRDGLCGRWSAVQETGARAWAASAALEQKVSSQCGKQGSVNSFRKHGRVARVQQFSR